jgi:hypothetical protein
VTLRPIDLFGLVGQVLDGQYRVDAVVGEGGYGVVYKGWHVAFEQPIAIKALKMNEVTNAETRVLVLTHFREEAKLLYVLSQASLSIVRCIGYGALVTPTQAWAPYLVLEWLEGRSLSEDLEERRRHHARGRSLEEALELLSPIAQALVYAHSQRVAHRDVKPANVFLPTDGGPKLLDFGIAKVMEVGATAANAQKTEGGVTAFTPYYAAPEQLDPRLGATGPWTDVYGFALTLSEMLADRAPMEAPDVVSVVARATDPKRRPTPRSLGVVTPDAVEAAFQRALAVDPKARFADIGSFWEALSAAAGPKGAGRPSAGLHGRPLGSGRVAPSHTVPLAAVGGGHHSGTVSLASAGGAPGDPGRAVLTPHPHTPQTLGMAPLVVAPGTLRPGAAPAPIPLHAGATAPPTRPRPRRWKLWTAVACLLLLSMIAGAYLASEYVK